MFNSVRNTPALSKAAMLAKLAAKGIVPQSSKLAGRNTLEYTDSLSGFRVWVLHDTPILVRAPLGGVSINTGGFNSVTTRTRLNQFLPNGWSVYTCKGVLHLRIANVGVFPFLEHIKVERDETHPHAVRVEPDVDPAQIAVDRKAIDAYMRKWKGSRLPKDITGDPWIFVPEGGKVEPETMRGWMQEGYVFRSLYTMAASYVHQNGESYASWKDREGGKLNARDLGMIRRYVRHCLGYA